MMQRRIAYLAIFPLFFIPFFLLMKKGSSARLFVAYFENSYYIYLVYSVILFFLVIVFVSIYYPKILKIAKNKLLGYATYVLLLPAVILPLFRCWFKFPYLFCHLCPNKCVFGLLRPFVLPSAIIINLKARFFCYNICPFGKLQTSQCFLNRRIISKIFLLTGILFLIFVVYAKFSVRVNSSVYDFFFKSGNSFSYPVVIGFLIILGASFFIARLWCDSLCPVGSLARAYIWIKKRFANLNLNRRAK